MTARIACIHAMRNSMIPTSRAFEAAWPEARIQNIMDDSLSVDVATTGLDEGMDSRFQSLADYAVACDADAILFTCSAFGSCIEKVKESTTLPVLKPNEAMMEEAVKIGGKIRVLSVFEPTVSSITREFSLTAEAAGVELDVHAVFIPSALDVLLSGDESGFNDIVANAAVEMVQSEPDTTCIALAMFSMACAGPTVQSAIGKVPVLTSPTSAIEKIQRLLEAN